MNGARSITVHSPAKINLGLEILGRRGDGYHDIRTVLAAISLSDTLSVTMVPDRAESLISGVPDVEPGDNLINKAIAAFAAETGIIGGYDVDVEKRIPSPGGLGGASSNAASTLMALDTVHHHPLTHERMHLLAARLGSDVPFFLGSSVAIASGTGTELEPLGSLGASVVLVVPRISLGAKTATLYGALNSHDFSDGSRVDDAARSIEQGNLPEARLLTNAFTRPLYALAPELKAVSSRILLAGAPHVVLTGAGPGHYVLLPTEDEALALADSIRKHVPGDTLVTVASLIVDLHKP